MRKPLLAMFASCPKGFEGLLTAELKALGATGIRETIAGVNLTGDLELAYRICLWSRLANKILMRIGEIESTTCEILYRELRKLNWNDHLKQDLSFKVDFTGSTPDINHTKFGARLVKDAIVDYFLDHYGWRPCVNILEPDIKFNIHAKGDMAFVSIDFSGVSLHMRGYRHQAGIAPLKENLAAAILYRAGWPEIAKIGGTLLDPLCGSGTLLIEGAMMAADIAPGLLRSKFGFEKWVGHHPNLWLTLLDEAKQRRVDGLAALKSMFIGYEDLPEVIDIAESNLRRANLSKEILIRQQELNNFLVDPSLPPGLVVTNPPYGERMGEEVTLMPLYKLLGEKLKQQTPGWQACIISSSPSLVRNIGMGTRKTYRIFNGALSCNLYLYDIREKKTEQLEPITINKIHNNNIFKPSTNGGEMFANRLRKNLRLIGKWAKNSEINCYRLYDADIPEYAVAVDIYGNWIHVQEYAAPKSIDPEIAKNRLHEAMEVIPHVLGIPKHHVVCKRRQKQSGKNQYERKDISGQMLEVFERNCRFLVNLKDYLDTGLFPDHRKIRLRIGHEASGKDFLNLFSYTGSATVHAAVGGAESTTSVDLSNTYLGWAKRNLAANNIKNGKHRFEQADCLTWLKQDKRSYDLILIDPPTFSNSKRTSESFCIQTAHYHLIKLAMNRLRKGGTLYFSNNFRKFRMVDEVIERFQVQEITHDTIDRDFKRRKHIHRCWKISHESNLYT